MQVTYRTMQEMVYDAIKDGIISGKYRPGQHLVVKDLTTELGVSQIPIREALHRLEEAGLVTMERHRGAMVSELSEQEILEIYRIRAVLDGLAAQLATPNLTQADLARLHALTDEMEAAGPDDLPRHLRANREFHLTIWTAARAPYLKELLEKLWATSQRFRSFSLLVPGHFKETIQSHRRMVAAFVTGNPSKAEEAAKEHHQKTVQYLMTLFHHDGPTPVGERPAG